MVADFLFDRISDNDDDIHELWDTVFAKVVYRLDWDQVPSDLAREFRAFALDNRSTGGRVDATTEAVARVLDLRLPEPELLTGQGDPTAIAIALNQYLIAGDRIPEQLLGQAIASVVSEMKTKARDAENGAYSGGGVSPAEMAAFLLDQADGDALWRELLQFLTNPNVARWDRTRAFDVLAARRPPMPKHLVSIYGSKLEFAMRQEDSIWASTGDSIVPYPAALRFGFVYSLIEDRKAFLNLAQLSASSDYAAREEAAATVSLFSSISGRDWIQVLALQLSHDSNPKVKAKAIRALAATAKLDDSIAGIASDRLLDLLAEDGVTIPLQVLRAIPSQPLDLRMRETIRGMRISHPSKRVRDRAAKILSEGDW